MANSIFTYNITRPYPFRWFTTVVNLGGLVSTALLSVITVATNGYNMKTVYTTDPNTTMSRLQWYQEAPWSWDNKLQNACEGNELAVGESFFTSNFGLSYAVQAEFQAETGSNTTDLSATIPYRNNTLQDCVVQQIRVQMERHDPCAGPDCSWLTWGLTTVTASASCSLLNAEPAYNVNITTKYDYMPADLTAFAKLDAMEQGSLWWGAMLLSMWFQALRIQMSHLRPAANYDWLDVTLWFDLSRDITDADFSSYLGSFSADGAFNWIGGNATVTPLSQWNNNTQPYLSQEMDGFAKALYSTVLTDLGQQKGPNILTNSDQLEDSLNTAIDLLNSYNVTISWPPPLSGNNQTYAALTRNNTVGPLRAKPAQRYVQYSCQIPTIKSWGSLMWTIIIGDLVILQALWQAFIFVTNMYLTRKHPHAMACEECSDRNRSFAKAKLMGDTHEARSTDSLVVDP